MLYLTEHEVTQLVGMRDALEVVEGAFKEQGDGTAVNLSRQRVRMPPGTLHVMAGALRGPERFGMKAYTTFAGFIKFHVFLYDRQNGRLLAIMEGDRLGQLRTGAASAIATKYLSLPMASCVGVIGTGWQARTQLSGICKVRKIESVRVYSRDQARREQFAEEMSQRHGVDVRAVDSGQAAAEGAQILVTITTSRQPVLLGDWVMPGAHVNAAGANSLLRREIDTRLIMQSDFICVDSKEQARTECGDLLVPIEKGLLDWNSVHELSDVVGGVRAGRKTTRDKTLFKSHGIAVEDIALAAVVYERAIEQGLGSEVTGDGN